MSLHSVNATLAFGNFQLNLATRSLSSQGRPIRVGGRAMDLLVALVTRPGQVLSHDELVAAAWPTTVVEATSLRVHISALRKTLGEEPGKTKFISNIQGRGYAFVDRVTVVSAAERAHAAGSEAEHMVSLPPVPSHLIGRDAVLAELSGHVEQRRLVTISAPGGMGKTSVAISVAKASSFPDGARFVDLSLLTQPGRVVAFVASALGSTVTQSTATQSLVSLLRGKRLLLVLDNCEHVLDSVAELVHALLRETEGIHVLATSREPLNLSGELVYWLEPLECLHEPASARAAPSAAATLFAERACLVESDFRLDSSNIAAVETLCVRLDGMPLAIELAAARISGLGIHGLVARLEHMFQILNQGRRTAPARQQTLRALLDWSFDLLSHEEQAVLRRLSVFRGKFSIKDAGKVAAWGAVGQTAVTRSILSLAARSLVVLDGDESPKQYRLLSTTRTYANEALHRSDEWLASITHHSELLIAKLAAAEAELDAADTESTAVLLTRHTMMLDDLRASIDWHFAPRGDTRLAIQLAVAAQCLLAHLGLSEEFRHKMSQALESALTLQPADPLLELRARIAVCTLSGPAPSVASKASALLEQMLELADELGTRKDKLAALKCALDSRMSQADFSRLLSLSESVRIASGQGDAAPSILLADRCAAHALHGLGRHAEAAALATKVLEHPTRKRYFQYIGPIPREVSMRVLLGRIAWIQGRPDAALELSEAAIDAARGASPHALGHALALGAIPISMWRGDFEAARLHLCSLREHARRHGQAHWLPWASVCELALAARPSEGEHSGLAAGLTSMEGDMAATLAPSLVCTNAVTRARAGEVGWCAPEILRAEALRLLAAGVVDGPAAQAQLLAAHDLALEQGAVGWQLRSAISLCQLSRSNGACSLHAPLLRRALSLVEGGANTADAKAASQALSADHATHLA